MADNKGLENITAVRIDFKKPFSESDKKTLLTVDKDGKEIFSYELQDSGNKLLIDESKFEDLNAVFNAKLNSLKTSNTPEQTQNIISDPVIENNQTNSTIKSQNLSNNKISKPSLVNRLKSRVFNRSNTNINGNIEQPIKISRFDTLKKYADEKSRELFFKLNNNLYWSKISATDDANIYYYSGTNEKITTPIEEIEKIEKKQKDIKDILKPNEYFYKYDLMSFIKPDNNSLPIDTPLDTNKIIIAHILNTSKILSTEITWYSWNKVNKIISVNENEKYDIEYDDTGIKKNAKGLSIDDFRIQDKDAPIIKLNDKGIPYISNNGGYLPSINSKKTTRRRRRRNGKSKRTKV